MTDRPFPFALREIRKQLHRRPVLLSLIGTGLLMGIVGPYDTVSQMVLLPRLAYWLVVVFGTYLLAAFINALLVASLDVASWPRWLRIPVLGLADGTAIMGFVTLLNAAIFGIFPASLNELTVTFAQLIAIAMIIVTLIDLALTSPAPAPDTIPLLDRLPLDKRGALIALSVTDHYVRVVTTQGADMILMRLADAIRETGSTQGMQVHRSHWVATAHITRVQRTGDRATLTLTGNHDIPVSRANISKLRDAGLLPKQATA